MRAPVTTRGPATETRNHVHTGSRNTQRGPDDGPAGRLRPHRYVLSGLNTWGWVTLILGALQRFACVSVVRGGQFGRWFGIAAAGLHAITALLALPAYPFWSLAVSRSTS